MKKSYLAFSLFLLVFLSPYFFSFREFTGLSIDADLVSRIYFYSSSQALMSTVLTLVIAVPGAMGLFWLRSQAPASLVSFVEFMILLPSLLPRLFILVSFLNLIPLFPFGLTGVVILHALSEAGLASLILHRLLQSKLSPYIESAELMGCSRKYFFKTVFPLIAPQVGQIGYVLFLFFISSVSIPLILAGGHYSSLEAAIYQKILVAHDWNQALNLFGLQLFLMASLVTLLGLMPATRTENVISTRSAYLGLPSGLLCILFPVGVILVSLLIKIPMGLISLAHQSHVLHGWRQYLVGSLFVGFLAGGISFVGLTFLTYFYQRSHLRRWFVFVMNPSSMILAFSFFLLPGKSPQIIYLKMAAALALGFLPALKRFGLLQKLENLTEQAEAAEILGAPQGRIFWRGIWPQALPVISLLSGLGAMWAMGDFAMSRIISGSDVTLAMWIQSLVDQYRWDMALVLSWMVLAASFVVFGFFWSLSYVSHKKLIEEV